MKQYRQGDIFLIEVDELPELDNQHYQSVNQTLKLDEL